MKIAIVSDTHIDSMRKFPEWIIKHLEHVDLIIHSGDIENPEVIEYLKDLAPVYAVRGNCDQRSPDLPISRSINIESIEITFAHKASDARRAIQPNTKVMVYGHTHLALINQEENLLVINPGSPTLPRGGLKPSIALLEVKNGNLKAELKHP